MESLIDNMKSELVSIKNSLLKEYIEISKRDMNESIKMDRMLKLLELISLEDLKLKNLEKYDIR
jgi:hypothetical protein